MSYNQILTWLSISFIFGIGAASYLGAPILFFWVGAFSATILFLFGWRKNQLKFLLMGVAVLGISLGILRYDLMILESQSAEAVQNWSGQKVFVEGVVSDEPDQRSDKTYLVVDAGKLSLSEGAESGSEQFLVVGKIRVKMNRFSDFEAGDKVKILGDLERPKNFSDFDYIGYLAKNGIYSVMNSAKVEKIGFQKSSFVRRTLFEIKNKLIDSLNRTLPEPQASFVAGIILGARQNIPPDVQQDFNNTGTTHLIALSGFNITIIASAIQNTARFLSLSPALSFWLAVFLIIIFTIGTGASASVVRAAIMGIISLVALRSGRMYNNKFALLLAGAVMVAVWPSILRFDLGFQLSFLATLGLVQFSEFFKEKFKKLTNFLALRENLSATLSAQIFVLPLLIINFQKISFVSPLVNVLVLPAIPYTMFLGFIGGIFGLIHPALGFLFNLSTWFLASFALEIISWFGALPFAAWNMDFLTAQFLGVLFLIAAIVIFSWKSLRKFFSE